MKIAIASDHAGVVLKADVKALLAKLGGYTVTDCGTEGIESVDYPDFADKACALVRDGKAERAILICGSGIGMSIAANRHPEIRAALCHSVEAAKLSRQHNDANTLALGERLTPKETALEIVKTFLETPFEGGRHQRRIDKLSVKK